MSTIGSCPLLRKPLHSGHLREMAKCPLYGDAIENWLNIQIRYIHTLKLVHIHLLFNIYNMYVLKSGYKNV